MSKLPRNPIFEGIAGVSTIENRGLAPKIGNQTQRGRAPSRKKVHALGLYN